MASYNTSNHHSTAADVLSSSLAAGGSNTQHHPQSLHHQFSNHPPPPHPLHHSHHQSSQQHFERSSSSSSSSTTSTTYLVPVTSSHLPLDSTAFLSASPHFVTSNPVSHTASNSSSSYTFVQIKREPCQVSEVTTSNTNNHHHTIGSIAAASSASSSLSSLAASNASGSLTAAKTMSSSTLTTLVKIEASSPKVHEMDKTHIGAQGGVGAGGGGGNVINSSNNTVPIGIAVARKRPQETTAPPPPAPPSLTSSSTLPLSQPLNKDMNCFGIRVADLGGVGTGCGGIYFTGNGDLMTSSATADELALANAANLQNVNRAPSTFWQYSNALPIESVISMSPATVGLQYSREASRGQVVLLPATATPLDPFQQAAAAALVWPSYIPQGTAPATLQPPPNFIFPSMSPHSTLQAAAAAQPYATSLQLLGSNYLTAAAAAAAAAAATSTLCQHNQQTNSTSSSINLSLGGSVSGSSSGTTMSSSSTTTRFMSLATTGGGGGGGSINDTGQSKSVAHKSLAPLSVPLPPPPTLALASGHSLISSAHQHSHSVPPPLLIPPSALKMEEWSSADFMAAASKTTTTTLTAAALNVPHPQQSQPPPPPAHYDHRDKNPALATTHSATNLLELAAPNNQALNLMRLPTPPTSATLESASAAGGPNHLQTQLLFQAAASSPTPSLINLSATLNRVTAGQTSQNSSNVASNLTPLAAASSPLNSSATGFLACSTANGTALPAAIGPPTPLADDMPALHFKSAVQPLETSTSPQIVVGVPRVVSQTLPSLMPVSHAQPAPAPPQMQDVNIQTDTPICSEDENSSCPLNPTATHCNSGSATGTGASSSILNSHTNSETCTTAQCTPPLTQNDELYHDAEAQQPLELTKSIPATNTHRAETPLVESSSQLHNEEQMPLNKSPLKQQAPAEHSEMYRDVKKGEEHPAPQHEHLPISLTPTITSSTATPHPNPEDMTGLELLSNISTSSLAKTSIIRIKQEPLDAVNETTMSYSAASEQYPAMESNSAHLDSHHSDQQNSLLLHAENLLTPPSPQPHSPSVSQNHVMSSHSPVTNMAPNADVEPLGGLKLLCALAEQRIHEEEEVQSTSMNATNGLFRSVAANSPNNFSCASFTHNAFVKPICSSSSAANSFSPLELQNSSFPSLETLELPSTSTTGTCFSAHMNDTAERESPVKRKKHKHSKSSKSSSIVNGAVVPGGSSKKSQKCSKKNKKKYTKEKKRHKLLAEGQQTDLDFDDPQLQQELKTAFQNCVDPSYQHVGKWPTPQEIFGIMESNMRMRLADITRQYRKKKRKLDEISKTKKSKKKCSKLQPNQQISLVGSSALSLAASERSSSATNAVVAPAALSSSPLCDYKFGKFTTKSSGSSATATSTNYLAPTNFMRFTTDTTMSQNHHNHLSTHHQFPPPPELDLESDNITSSNCTAINSTSTLIYKPVRLEPSSLDQCSITATHSVGGSSGVGGSGGGGTVGAASSGSILRLARKRSSPEKHSNAITCKEPNLSGSTSSHRSSANEDVEHVDDDDEDDDDDEGCDEENEDNEKPENHLNDEDFDAARLRNVSECDRKLILLSKHLSGVETRVLTDMGGLFYAGILRAVEAPDVYAITLDGERGNKSHIIPREEVLRDTILEVAPATVEDVAVGTRLCAYWSQQYRCLYPGRVIESGSSDDDATAEDFVCVEFDDGDSGKIRLQNIRFLMSDYPQVEYNDNPLYSLGKHKKSNGNKISSNNESDQHHLSHGDEDTDIKGSQIMQNGSDRDYHQATAMEIFAAKRSEKKRNKSLKRKSEGHIKSNNNATTNGKTGVSCAPDDSTGLNGSLEPNPDCVRKHHKHKKRKKHKKHRKNLMEVGIVSELDKSSYKASGSTSRSKKSERMAQAVENQPSNCYSRTSAQEEVEDEAEEDTYDENQNTQMEDSQIPEDNNIKIRRIKQESNGHISSSNVLAAAVASFNSESSSTLAITSANIKVKTEHLEDIEDESTSNLMSEISDEAKVENNNSKGSKIAAFLPDRQLWGWLGKNYCKQSTKGAKGRVRKQFYKTIKRGKETITVGDCAVFLSTGRPDRPYIGRIELMWENSNNNKIVRVSWFYHPEETVGCPKLKYPGGLFESPHEDENDVQTISHRCEVLDFQRYYNKFGDDYKQYASIYDNNDTYYLAGCYNPKNQALKLNQNIPIMEKPQDEEEEEEEEL